MTQMEKQHTKNIIAQKYVPIIGIFTGTIRLFMSKKYVIK